MQGSCDKDTESGERDGKTAIATAWGCRSKGKSRRARAVWEAKIRGSTAKRQLEGRTGHSHRGDPAQHRKKG